MTPVIGASPVVVGNVANPNFPAPSPNANRYPKLHAALANARIGNITAGQAGIDSVLVVLGESTTYGVFVVNGFGAARPLSLLLNSAGYTSAMGLTIPRDFQTSQPPGGDSRITAPANWTISVNNTLSWAAKGAIWNNTTLVGTLSYTPGTLCDTFDVYWLDGSSSSFNINVDGGANTLVTGSAVNGVHKTTVTTAVANTTHVCNIVPSAAGFGINIIGFEARLSQPGNTVATIRCAAMGASGALTSDWVNQVSSPIGPLDCIRGYANNLPAGTPLVFLCVLGINDYGNGVPVATTIANLTTILSTLRNLTLAPDVIFSSPLPTSSSANPPFGTNALSAPALVSAIQTFALANGCGYIDLFNAWGGANSPRTGLTDPFDGGDGLHPSAMGYADMGRVFYQGLLSL